jgi:DNA-binding protein YbaB
MMKGGMAGLMKQAQQMQEKMAKSPVKPVAIWSVW